MTETVIKRWFKDTNRPKIFTAKNSRLLIKIELQEIKIQMSQDLGDNNNEFVQFYFCRKFLPDFVNKKQPLRNFLFFKLFYLDNFPPKLDASRPDRL